MNATKYRPKIAGVSIKKTTNWLRDESHAEIYHSTRWRKLRSSYMMRNPVCEMYKCTQPSKYLDHIKPISNGGEIWDEDNLQALCASCNGIKTVNQRY